jgi:hypothetical protein
MNDEEGPEVALRKLTQQFGVLSYVIMNKTGIPVKFHGMEGAEATHYAGLASELAISTRELLECQYLSQAQKQRFEDDPELHTIRLRTHKHEIIISPEANFTLIVVHDPNYVEPEEVAVGLDENSDNDGSDNDSV